MLVIKRRSRFISSLTISGYKSFYEPTTVEFGALTVLAGINSGGKSSIVQPLLLLKQTLESTNDPGALKIDGPNVHFSELAQFFSKIAGRRKTQRMRFDLKFGLRTESTGFISKFASGGRVLDVEFSERTIDGLVSKIAGSSTNFEDFASYWDGALERKELVGQQIDPKQVVPLIRQRYWLAPNLDGNDKVSSELRFLLLGLSRFREVYSTAWLMNLIHVPGLRGLPERNYRVIGVGKVFPGRFEEHTASVIKHWQNNGDSRAQKVSDALYHLGLTHHVEAKTINAASVDLQISRLGKAKSKGSKVDLVSVADVGFGVSQVLPVVVALVAAAPGQAVFIEQPEIHLHPKAQAALADLICDAINRDVQVIVETHSSILLVSLQAAIAERKIRNNEVKMHWVARDKAGQSVVTTAEIGADGSYGDWPVDFDIEAEKANLRYLQATVFKG